ncbi:hypothetical protein [Photobacterium sp.]|uniref:hypothetical protein n=1 Tax=Photobacterium sp. TaxID=660 RepID=UPI00299D71EF|nr:hypothetical protein [Photobacterium sp.]MDX1300920.1 hypothetical protein [Photobacterium sp.]
MSLGHIMVTSDDLYAALSDVGMRSESKDIFVNIFNYIEDMTGEWFALDTVRAQSIHVAHDPVLLAVDEIYAGWFAFWMCVFNSSDHGSELEAQAMGSIRSLFFVAAHNRQITVPSAIETWWLQTADIHRNHSLNEVAA